MASDKLKGEGEVQIIQRERVRRKCENCGAPAMYRNTYLDERSGPARRNPASSAYREDDCSWCSDHDQYLCRDCHCHNHEEGVPEGFKWCSAFMCGDRFAHMFLEWRETRLEDEQGAA